MKTLAMDADQVRINFKVDGARQKAHHSWFRGAHCNFNPTVQNLLGSDAVLRHVLQGWLPAQPIIRPETRLVAFGSCFAANIAGWLSNRKFKVLTDKAGAHADAYVVRFGEGMVNSFVIRQQFEWALENRRFEEELWHGYDAQAFGYDETVRLQTKALFDQADVFVLTLGLSEVWYDEWSGGVFWRAVPRSKYDPARHKFRVSTVAENKENLHAILELIRRHRPDAKVVLTLSPIPLVATFRAVSCITANSVSKAVLRAAVDEVLRELGDQDSVLYWPSYEIIMDVFAQRWQPDRRHVKRPIIDFVMTLFEAVYCAGSAPTRTIPEAWIRARVAAGTLPPGFLKVVNGDRSRLDGLRKAMLAVGRRQDADLLLDYADATSDREVALREWSDEVRGRTAAVQ